MIVASVEIFGRITSGEKMEGNYWRENVSKLFNE